MKLTTLHRHTCALAHDGRVWCWGENSLRQLGDSDAEGDAGPGTIPDLDRGTPVPVRGLPGRAVDVSAGHDHTCAVVEAGDVYCWGLNVALRVTPNAPDFAVLARPTRVDVPGVRFSSVRAGAHHTCALSTEGTVYCWGSTIDGQCGVDGNAIGVHHVGPTPIPGIESSGARYLDKVRQIETVTHHTCAVRTANPTLVCWGSNRYDSVNNAIPEPNFGEIVHKLGPQATQMTHSSIPIPTELDGIVLDVGISFEATYAVTSTGKAYAWGLNRRWQLGTGDDAVATPTPMPVKMLRGSTTQFLWDVAEVLRSFGSNQCARLHEAFEGSHYVCWGADDHGELGFGTAGEIARTARAVTVLPISTTSVARGDDHTCAIVNEVNAPAIWCYGVRPLLANGDIETGPDRLEPSPISWNPNAFLEALK